MTSKEKIRDIKSVINEFYHNEKCEGKLTECARKSWLVFQEYCNDILQDLERLETLENNSNKVIKNSVKLLNKNLELQQENEKLKKAINYEIELLIERRFNAYACDNYEVYNVIDAIIEELKEVLE